jgi:hypothetical protein
LSAGALALVAALALAQGGEATFVAVPDLTRRDDLVGRRVAVDGRVRLYQLHNSVFDEILLHGTTATLRLPPRLAYRDAPGERSLIARGTLRKQDDRYYLDVDQIQLQPDDATRLERGLAALAPGDLAGRRGWANWASRRAKLYDDPDLAAKARELETQLARREAEGPDAASPEAALALAKKGRAAGVAEPIPSGLAHRAFAARARSAGSDPNALEALAGEVAAFLPDAREPHEADLSGWDRAYRDDPYRAYVAASDDERKALDRRLWADLIERSLRARAQADPSKAIALADEARDRLPDRPGLSKGLRDQGLAAATRDVSKLRRSEVLERAEQYRKAGQPGEATALIREWLVDRRRNLGGDEIYERLGLAQDYDELAGDRDTAVELIREAAGLDPASEPVHQAFRRLGYTRRGDEWVPIDAPRDEPGRGAAAVGDDPIVGLTPEEVAAQLGQPNRRSQALTQGRVTIQWVYTGSGGRTQFVVQFVKQPGFPARAVSRYTPR